MSQAREQLVRLCSVRPDRRPGSRGNVEATDYVADVLRGLGWAPQLQWFDCLDWETDGGQVALAGRTYPLTPAPYGTGISARGRLVAAATQSELTDKEATNGSVLLLHGSLTAAPLTPRNYPFYSSAEDEHLLRLIEGAAPAAVVAVTGRAPELCGALDPFPFIEDGTVQVPAASVPADTGRALLGHVGQVADVHIASRRRPARAANVLARRGRQDRRVTVVAHIDTKPGTPGALDNGTGVVALLQVAAELADEPADGALGIELLAVNGEDNYAAPGELAYLRLANVENVALAVNLDGVGLPGGPSAWSLYECPPALHRQLTDLLSGRPGLVEGPPWFQSDHAIFAAKGRPALALTSADLATALGSVAHAPTDTPEGVDLATVGDAAHAVAAVVLAVTGRDVGPPPG